MHKKKKIIFIILTILWMLTVFCFSSENSNKSSNTSGNTIKAIIRIFVQLPQEKEDQVVEQLQHIVRKMAHFTLYAIGGIILINLVRCYTSKKAWIHAWGTGTTYAITDEIHQYFVPGRSCELLDIFIDSAGVITGILIILGIIWLINKKYKKNVEKSSKIVVQ